MGPAGPRGVGAPLAFAEFYGLPAAGDARAVAPGEAIAFPSDGASSGPDVMRRDDSSFILGAVGVYAVFFQVPVSGGGQLLLSLDGCELPCTAVGHGAGTCELVGMSLITTTRCGGILCVLNPTGGAPLIPAPAAGGGMISAHLIILRLA